MVLDSDDKLLIKKECRKCLPAIRDIHKVKESSWSRVYHILTADQTFFCKAGPLSSAVTNEHRALSFLFAKGLRCVPEVIRYWEGRSSAFLVTRFIQGPGHYDAGRLGSNFAQVHSLKHQRDNCQDFTAGLISGMENELSDLQYWWGKVNPKRVRLLNEAGSILNKMRSLYKKKKKFFIAQRASFIHMDAQDAVIPCGDEMYLVDWHMARYGDPACDLARLCAYERQQTTHFDQEYLMKAYCGGKELEESMAWRMCFYHAGSEAALLLYSFGDCANLVRYRASPLVVGQREEGFLGKLLDHKIEKSLHQIHSDLERL
jgi:fructosamine-3-kinase